MSIRFAVVGAGLVFLGSAAMVQAGQVGAPQRTASPHLMLLSAEIAEVMPRGRPRLRDRQVAFQLEVAAPPPCSAQRPGVSYTFLLDTDRSTATGVSLRDLRELGADLRITIRCDAARGRFVSALGAVDTGPAAQPDRWHAKVLIPLRVLPSAAFDWAAIAREGAAYDRIPRSGDVARWEVFGSRPW